MKLIAQYDEKKELKLVSEDEARARKAEKDEMKAIVLAAYDRYPKKKGKRKGIDRLFIGKYKLKDLEEALKFAVCVDNYAAECNDTGRDYQYINHFDTFVTKWEDYLNYTPVVKKPEITVW